MVNTTHLKVLLKKDSLTLWRNKGFLFAFIFLPVVLMNAFIQIQGLVDNGEKSGSLIAENFRYTGNNPWMPFEMVLPVNAAKRQQFTSPLGSFSIQNLARYKFTRFAVISNDTCVAQHACDYFNSYVFGPINQTPPPLAMLNMTFDEWECVTWDSQQDFFKNVSNENKEPYAASWTIRDFDTEKDVYEIEVNFPKTDVPDTNLPAFNELVRLPNLIAWQTWLGNVQKPAPASVYPYLYEFIARYKVFNKTHGQVSPPPGTPCPPLQSLENDEVDDFKNTTPLYTQQVGYGPMQSSPFEDISSMGLQQLTMNFPFFYMIMYLIPFYYLTSKIAQEKESKSREGMKMMGLQDSTYYLAWFICFFCICLLTAAITCVFVAYGIFKKTDMILFFIFNMLYSMTLYGWAFMIVAFIPSKRSSGIAATLLHIISYYLAFILKDPTTPSSLQYGMSIFPNVCMKQIVKQIFFYNFNTDTGLSFETTGIAYQGYSFQNGLLMMSFDVVFWTLFGFYCDQVVPSQFGIAKPWNFLCKCGGRRNRALNVDDEAREALLGNDEIGTKDKKNFERVDDNIKRQEKNNECLKVRGLVKKFGDKTAVNNVNMTMYSGQIFALLGHNGAGKTTTISMLTGLIPPNEGVAEVFGTDIFGNMSEVRKYLGVCPQHDVLFEFLTPEEHLKLFAAFKGTEASLIDSQVKDMLDDIELTDVKNQITKTLSGGQKRKLSVAIAMIGNSKVVMLDEPTSGMDTTARRKLWEMLKKNKAGRIVILTTHYMDEADILGDRIAIMAEGDVQCTGSSLFLKNRYGVGYNLVIAKKERTPAPQIDEFITSRIQSATKIQEVSGEISYQLPTSSSGQFKDFFSQFDQQVDALGVRSYGVGITTLEEVFLKIGHGEEVEQVRFDKAQAELTDSKVIGQNEQQALTKLDEYTISEDAEEQVFWLHLRALTRKKILMQVRDMKTLGIDTIFPILLIIVGLALATITIFKDGVPRDMSPHIYSTPAVPQLQLIYNKNAYYESVTEQQISKFVQQNIIDSNRTAWVVQEAVPMTFKLGEMDFLKSFADFDNHIFQKSQANGQTYFGQFYIANLKKQEKEYAIGMLLNSTSQDIVGSWGAFAHETILKQYLRDHYKLVGSEQEWSPPSTWNLTITDQPFPLSKLFVAITKSTAGTVSAILMTIAWMMMSDSLVQNIIKEREGNIKHQIIVSGASLGAYWMGNYISDIIFQAIPACAAIAGVHAFGLDIPGVELLFLITIFTNPAFIYFFSFLFEKDDAGSLAIKMMYFIIGIIAPLTVSILLVVNEDTQNVAQIMRWFFYPFPVYCLTYGYIAISNKAIMAQINTKSLTPTIPGSFDMAVAGPSIIFLLGEILFFWVLIYLIEKGFITCRRKQAAPREQQNGPGDFLVNQNMGDEDVIAEANRIKSSSDGAMPVKINQVSKNYSNVVALDKLTFGLDFGECFALLGVSGAGKTTTFKALTGVIVPDAGMASIAGNDISTNAGFDRARKLIGYCPQFDAIFTGLTVREHLEIYAALKGIRAEFREDLINKAIKDMDLEDYTRIRANNLSGGNKRKMSVAIAMLGNPPIVFLDEPSTGVDPQAKRFMWNIVSKISTLRKKSSVIITTHSMEEAEALCTKMGIMVGGQFKCFGSSQHIKDKYGTGYELEVKIKTLTEQEIEVLMKQCALSGYNLNKDQCFKILKMQQNEELVQEISETGIGATFHDQFEAGKEVDAAEFMRWQFTEKKGNAAIDYLEKQFEQLEIVEHFSSSWKLKVSRDKYSIGYLFGMMEDIQVQFAISEYSVIQTTLEQIFNNFANQARVGGPTKSKSLRRRSTAKNEIAQGGADINETRSTARNEKRGDSGKQGLYEIKEDKEEEIIS